MLPLNTKPSIVFIEQHDDLSILINEKANELFYKIRSFNIQQTGIDDYGKFYFTKHHSGNRLYFSIESSARIIYDSVKLSRSDMAALNFLDYGAGLGTLFLLAGMLDFKQVYYNDYGPVWCENAKIICKELEIPVKDFITGDIDAVIDYSKEHAVRMDIIASRNVIEHIYRPRIFYKKLYETNITTVCYATTTANFHNIAMRLKHHWHHKKIDKSLFKPQRKEVITKLVSGINNKKLDELAELTRGKAFNDFTNAVNLSLAGKPVEAVEFLRTNTCDCKTGVWAENIISRKDYTDIIEGAGFSLTYSPGFWDTHYKYKIANLFSRFLNMLISILGKKGYWLSPFVNVIALNKQP